MTSKQDVGYWNDIYRYTPLHKIPWHTDMPPRSLQKTVGKLKNTEILDVCCGAGTNAIFMAKNKNPVTCIDIAPDAIKIAKSRAKKEGVTDFITFKKGDVLDLNVENRYGMILDRGCFHHMPVEERDAYIRKMYKALKQNGLYYLMVFSERNYFGKSFSKKMIYDLFSPYFIIKSIKEEIHVEPDRIPIFLYTVVMNKK